MIRLAQEKDIPRIIDLLKQVLEIHANIRPDIFVSGTSKYDVDEVKKMLNNDSKPIYVATDDADNVLGYAMCMIKDTPEDAINRVKIKQMFIDDLCVDEAARGQHVGSKLFEYVKSEAKKLGCYEVTLCVWSGNDKAESFYESLGMQTKEKIMEYIL
ncbi:GNAT family N-acetyltransferase [Lachnobacterium bovis]|uniref:GNAT family N-acetyltransferase n=1 Tax=Lachnobacterium bovis TaxID=140626 RepID=UPI0004817649|nr:GNAT family N-acetyltransferase [Lachnobacterium bovis]